ncbi:MAG: efflux RND transporter periplasmic adaptor subunit [Gemmatimonadota bacterium]|nr:efflux RND transporter periplasmic adaptor subunit [Gemmatimonadota bacterium]
MKPESWKYFVPVWMCAVVCLSLSCLGPQGGEPADLAVTRVVRRDFTSTVFATVFATGVVRAQVGAEVLVGARTSGRVERLHTNIGDLVQKGDLIAELEKKELEATVAQRQAELSMARASLTSLERLFPKEVEKAEADVAKWEATVVLARKDLARKSDLVEEDLAAESDLDQAREQLAVAGAELAAARKALEVTTVAYEENIKLAHLGVESAGAALDNAKAQLGYTTITAPIPGVIASVATQEGETVAAGLNAPTFVTIIDLNRLQVDAYVDEVDIGKIQPGQRASFSVEAFPARDFEGEVLAIYPKAVIQDNVVNYDVVIGITQPYEGLLRPEMTASVTIYLKNKVNVLALPVMAVLREGGRNVVYLPAEGRPQRREIEVGWQDNMWIEVASGLEEGQEVLLKPPARPAENQ